MFGRVSYKITLILLLAILLAVGIFFVRNTVRDERKLPVSAGLVVI